MGEESLDWVFGVTNIRAEAGMMIWVEDFVEEHSR